MATPQLNSDPKFTVRYTLGLFLLSNWLYNTLIIGPEGIADFSQISDDVFNDSMFYVGAYKQILGLVADINDERIINEMVDGRTLLLNRVKLKEMLKLDDTKMKELVEQGVGVYDMLVAKKLAENTIFDEDVVPDVYEVIDGSDKSASDITIPLSLVFSIDSDLLTKISSLFDMDDATVVPTIIAELQLDKKMSCFRNSFDFLARIDAKV